MSLACYLLALSLHCYSLRYSSLSCHINNLSAIWLAVQTLHPYSRGLFCCVGVLRLSPVMLFGHAECNQAVSAPGILVIGVFCCLCTNYIHYWTWEVTSRSCSVKIAVICVEMGWEQYNASQSVTGLRLSVCSREGTHQPSNVSHSA